MKATCRWRSYLSLSVTFGLLSACTLNPNARKEKDYRNGLSFLRRGEYSAAKVEFSKATKIDPAYADAHFQLGQSYILMQQPNEAYQEFARTIDLRPDDYRARLAMANLLILRRDFTQAKEQTAFLLKQRPTDPAVHSTIASLLAAEGDIPGAIRETEQTIALAPGHWEPYLSLALLQMKVGQPDAAESDFKKVIEMDPKEVRARVLLGSFYQSTGRAADAEQQFREGMAIAPDNMAPRQALARLYMSEGKTGDAEHILLQARQDLPRDPDATLALSNFYFVTGNQDKAIAEYAALYQERPNDTVVKKKYIQLLIQTRRYDQAQKLNDEILQLNPGDNDALVDRSEIQISEGDINDAVQTLQTVVNNAPNNSLAHYAFGVALEKQGYPERAVGEWRQALNLDPNDLDAERALANEAMLQGDMNALQDAANQIIRMEPSGSEGYALRALSSINRGQFDTADRDVRRAIEAAPESAFGYVQLGNLKSAQKQYGDAVKAYQQALDRNAGSTDALRGVMSAYAAEKQPDKAIEAAKKQIGLVPANSSFYDLLGAALFHFMKDFNGAEGALEKSVALDGHNVDAVIQLCQVQAATGRIDQAIASGEQSLKLNPRQTGIYIVLGDLYAAKSDWKNAQARYQSADTLSPFNPVAANDLARAMLHTGGNLDTAMSLAQTARRGMPESPTVADTMGWIYYQRGEYALAVSSLKLALSLEQKHQLKNDPDIQYHLGMAYEKAKQPAQARTLFENLLKNNPNYRGADIQAELAGLKS